MESKLGAPPSLIMCEIKTCRLCLSRTPVAFSLLDSNIGDILEAVAAIQISFEDPVSTECCVKCLLNLKLAYRIRQGMIAAAKQGSEDVAFVSIKQESSSVDYLEEMVISDEDDVGDGSSSAASEHGHDEGVCKGVKTFKAQCQICCKTFEDLGCYNSHFRECFRIKSEVHDDENDQVGTKGQRHDNKKNVIRWVKTERKPKESAEIVATNNGRYQCEVCSKEYATRARCWNHWYNLHKLKPCPICKKLYSTTNLYRHMDMHSTETVVCDLCGKTCKNKSSLVSHKFYNHNSLRHNCEHCGKAFIKKIELSIHINKEHTDSPVLYICESCGKQFKDPYLLRKHILRIHERKRDFICTYCNKNFSSGYSLKTHTRQHTNETPYRCGSCGNSFRQHVHLKLHLKSKHGIEEKKDVPCEVCGKAFATKHAIKAHMRLHNS